MARNDTMEEQNDNTGSMNPSNFQNKNNEDIIFEPLNI